MNSFYCFADEMVLQKLSITAFSGDFTGHPNNTIVNDEAKQDCENEQRNPKQK